ESASLADPAGHRRRLRRERGQERGLADRQLARRASEPVVRGCANAVDARAELDDVEVPLDDRLLVEPGLEAPRQDRLLELPVEAPAVREQRVLDELLADRRAAACEPAIAQVDLEAARDLHEVE